MPEWAIRLVAWSPVFPRPSRCESGNACNQPQAKRSPQLDTKRGGHKGTSVGRHEGSDSETGAVRDPDESQVEPHDDQESSHQRDNQSHVNDKSGDNIGRGKGGVRTEE